MKVGEEMEFHSMHDVHHLNSSVLHFDFQFELQFPVVYVMEVL